MTVTEVLIAMNVVVAVVAANRNANKATKTLTATVHQNESVHIDNVLVH